MRRVGLPVDQLPDDALVAGLAAGDEEVTVAFVRRFQSRVYGVALAVTGDPGRAEDVAQQAFERAWRHAAGYDPLRGTVGAWLATITRNLAIDALRAGHARPAGTDDLLERVVPAGEEPETAAAREEAAGELRAALRRLPPEQARAVVLAGIAGLSAAEVARREGIPLGTAKTRIRTALHRLRAELTITGTDHG